MASKYAVLAWPVDLDRTFGLLSADLPKEDAETLVRHVEKGGLVCDLLPVVENDEDLDEHGDDTAH